MRTALMAVIGCALVFTGAVGAGLTGQLRYARGQDVSPTFDGWEQNSDGSYTLYFGYFNRNLEEELDVPIGPENNVQPGNDRGQPTHFYTTRKWWVFRTVVPKDWPKDQRVVWTLTTHGMTSQAKGWLQPEWEVDRGVIAKNAARDPFLMTTPSGDIDPENLFPSLTVSPPQTTSLAEAVALVATVTDDGRPKPVLTAGQQGLRVRWIFYRGPGQVRLEPDIMNQRVYGKPVTFETKARFSAPGTYRLRAIANDGQLFSTADVDVTVRR